MSQGRPPTLLSSRAKRSDRRTRASEPRDWNLPPVHDAKCGCLSIAAERLLSQRLLGAPLRDAASVVRWLVASQAQDFAGAKWALGLRMGGADDAAIEREFDSGSILRTHVLRPTWHFVTPEDIRWLLELSGPRVNEVNARRYRELGLDSATLRRSSGVLARALEGGRHSTRDELRLALTRAGIGVAGQRMAHILMHAELDGAVCSGPRRGKQFTYALLDERAPRGHARSREEALAELASRYFASRGPATVQDFSWWSGLPAADARAGLEAVRMKLRGESIGGRTCWAAARKARSRRPSPRAFLLSIYDEYLSAYRDRRDICDPDQRRRIWGSGSVFLHVLVVDGRIAGTWKRTFDRDAVRVVVSAFRRLDRAERRGVEEAAARFAWFVGRGERVELEIDSAAPARRSLGRFAPSG